MDSKKSGTDSHPSSEGGTDTAEPDSFESAPYPSFPPKFPGRFPATPRGLRKEIGAKGLRAIAGP